MFFLYYFLVQSCLTKLFDSGYISFDDEGKIIISDLLSKTNRELLNVNDNMSIDISLETQEYMKYHRENKFH